MGRTADTDGGPSPVTTAFAFLVGVLLGTGLVFSVVSSEIDLIGRTVGAMDPLLAAIVGGTLALAVGLAGAWTLYAIVG